MADGRAGTFSGCCYGSRVQWSSKGIISHRIRDDYGRIGTLWSPASALVRFCAYGAAGIMILGVMAVVPRQRRVWTCLGERSLQIYILHRPIRDLMEAAGFYRAVTSRSRMTVVFVMAFSVALAVCLSAPRITKLFRYVQDAPEKMFRLIGQNRF